MKELNCPLVQVVRFISIPPNHPFCCPYIQMMMSPSSEDMPELKRWKPTDAALTWSFKEKKGESNKGFFTVNSFV